MERQNQQKEFTEIDSFMEVGAFLKAVKANLLHGCSKTVTSQTEKEKHHRWMVASSSSTGLPERFTLVL